jgi:hypothetical protein
MGSIENVPAAYQVKDPEIKSTYFNTSDFGECCHRGSIRAGGLIERCSLRSQADDAFGYDGYSSIRSNRT